MGADASCCTMSEGSASLRAESMRPVDDRCATGDGEVNQARHGSHGPAFLAVGLRMRASLVCRRSRLFWSRHMMIVKRKICEAVCSAVKRIQMK